MTFRRPRRAYILDTWPDWRFSGEDGPVKYPKTCPYRHLSAKHGLLCFDPGLGEYVKFSAETIRTWCRTDFRKCPAYLGNLHPVPGMSKHFKILRMQYSL